MPNLRCRSQLFTLISQDSCKIGIVSDVANWSVPKLLQKIMQIFMQVLNTCCRPCFNPGSLDALNHRCVPGAGSGDGVLIDWCIITKSSKKIFLGKPLGSPLQSFKFVRERLPRRLAIAWRRPHSSFQGRLVKTKGRREWRCCVLKKSSNNDQH